MQINYALILSAGLGTRMGEIGKRLPKVLWPIYFKTLLELQIRYCQGLGIEKIYINTHFLHDEIENFLKSNHLDKDIIILHEDPLLDSGGAIHNLASRSEVQYQGNLLLINGDQFLFFKKSYWEKALANVPTARAVLFGIKVDKDSAYNETVLENNKLVDIRKNTEKKFNYVTYSGLGILNLNGLTPVKGISSFFETVANYRSEDIQFVTLEECEYWDFGTADLYAQNIKKLFESKNKTTEMGIFLKGHGAFSGDEKKFFNPEMNSIDLDYKGRFFKRTLCRDDVRQEY